LIDITKNMIMVIHHTIFSRFSRTLLSGSDVEWDSS